MPAKTKPIPLAPLQPSNLGAETLTAADAMQADDTTFLKFAQTSASDGMERVALSKKVVEESREAIEKASKLGAES